MVHFVTTQRAKALLSNQPASTQGAKVKSGVELALEDVRGYFGMLRELLASDSVCRFLLFLNTILNDLPDF